MITFVILIKPHSPNFDNELVNIEMHFEAVALIYVGKYYVLLEQNSGQYQQFSPNFFYGLFMYEVCPEDM